MLLFLVFFLGMLFLSQVNNYIHTGKFIKSIKKLVIITFQTSYCDNINV